MSGRLDSNQRPPRPERGALPGCATARKLNINKFMFTIPLFKGGVTSELSMPGREEWFP